MLCPKSSNNLILTALSVLSIITMEDKKPIDFTVDEHGTLSPEAMAIYEADHKHLDLEGPGPDDPIHQLHPDDYGSWRDDGDGDDVSALTIEALKKKLYSLEGGALLDFAQQVIEADKAGAFPSNGR